MASKNSSAGAPPAAPAVQFVATLTVTLGEMRLKDVDSSTVGHYAVLSSNGSGRTLQTEQTTSETPDRAVFDETFTFSLARAFVRLRLNVFSARRRSRAPYFAGELVLTDRFLRAHPGEARFFPLLPALTTRGDGLVTGELLLDLLLSDDRASLEVTVVRALNLASKDSNGSSDPFVTLVLGASRHTTEIRKATLNPEFDARFVMPLGDAHTLTAAVFDWDAIGADDFMGQVRLDTRTLVPGKRTVQWYILCPRAEIAIGSEMKGGGGGGGGGSAAGAAPGPASPALFAKRAVSLGTNPTHNLQDEPEHLNHEIEPSASGSALAASGSPLELGQLYIRYVFTELTILPAVNYTMLRSALLGSPLSMVVLAGNTKGDQELVAGALVSFFADHKMDLPVLTELLGAEIARTSSAGTVFRSNTIITRFARLFLESVARGFLAAVVTPLAALIGAAEDLEVDPNRLSPDDNVEANWARLIALVETVVHTITGSLARVPRTAIELFAVLRQDVAARWPDDAHAPLTAVGGFFFLRLVNPTLIGLAVAPMHRRAMTLVTKTLQNLANHVPFGSKEPFMGRLNPTLERLQPQLDEFVNAISMPPPARVHASGSSAPSGATSPAPSAPASPSKLGPSDGKREAQAKRGGVSRASSSSDGSSSGSSSSGSASSSQSPSVASSASALTAATIVYDSNSPAGRAAGLQALATAQRETTPRQAEAPALAQIHHFVVSHEAELRAAVADAPELAPNGELDALIDACREITKLRISLVANAETAPRSRRTSGVLATPPAMPSDEILARLCAGSTFFKYKASKSMFSSKTRELRHVYWVKDREELAWREPGAKKVHGFIPFDEIEDVLPGFQTKVFLQYGKPEAEHKAFSVVTATRTLDLECGSEAERDEFVWLFRQLLPRYAGLSAVTAKNVALM